MLLLLSLLFVLSVVNNLQNECNNIYMEVRLPHLHKSRKVLCKQNNLLERPVNDRNNV